MGACWSEDFAQYIGYGYTQMDAYHCLAGKLIGDGYEALQFNQDDRKLSFRRYRSHYNGLVSFHQNSHGWGATITV